LTEVVTISGIVGKTRSLLFTLAPWLLVAAVALASVGGTAVALGEELSGTYTHSPGSNVLERVSVTAESGDAVVANGPAPATVDFSTDNRFDGNLENVSRVDVLVAGQDPVPANFSTSGDGQITVTPERRISLEAGDRMFVRTFNFITPSTPTQAGETNWFQAAVTLTGGEGTTDTATVEYPTTRATLSFPNQTASQFDNQSIALSGTVANFGYMDVFRTAENGSRGELVGSVPIQPDHDPQNFTVALNGNVTESQPLRAVAFYETDAETLRERRQNGSFDPATDPAFANNGQVVSATGSSRGLTPPPASNPVLSTPPYRGCPSRGGGGGIQGRLSGPCG
jgi:hypothetical protein